MRLFLSILLFVLESNAAVRYIASNGSDTNNGLTTSTPWAHLPGMATCASVCAAYTPAAADRFIFRGGDTWANSNFPINWAWSGTAGNQIYIGVDKTWYSGSSWVRPIFDAGGTAISGTNRFFSIPSDSYIQIDELEMTGMWWTGTPPYGNVTSIFAFGSYITISNCYFHGWTHDGGATTDDFSAIQGSTNPPYNLGSVATNNICDGSGAGSDSGICLHYFPTAINNVIHDMPNGHIMTQDGNSVGNHIYNITTSFSGVHENAIEAVVGGTHLIANNYIHDVTGEGIFVGNNNEIDYVWNNVLVNAGNGPDVDSRGGPSSVWFLNNTVIRPFVCFHQVGSGALGTITIQNNHCIATGSVQDFTTGSQTITNNILQSPTAALSDGYSAASWYVYSPTVATGATIRAGTNLTATCGVSGVSSLCADTAYACSVGSTKHVVCPARQSIARVASGAWDSGAYQYAPIAAQIIGAVRIVGTVGINQIAPALSLAALTNGALATLTNGQLLSMTN